MVAYKYQHAKHSNTSRVGGGRRAEPEEGK